jgi:DNA-binding beta-propeller fold protein YncE
VKTAIIILIFFLISINTVNSQSKIYWIDSYLDQIKRANLDGSDVELIVNLGDSNPQGIDIDNEHGKIYWIDSYLGAIKRANLDGSNIELIDSLGNAYPRGIVIDDKHGKIYWVDSYLDVIQRANLDGSDVKSIDSLGNAVPEDIAIDKRNNKIYWVDSFLKQISRADLDGSNVEVIINIDSLLGPPTSIAVDEKHEKIYWIDSWTQSANLDGTNIQTINNYYARSIDIDDKHGKIYWLNGKIERANLDGSSIETILDLGHANPRAIAISKDNTYFPLEIGNRWKFVEGWNDEAGNSFADTIIYWVNSDTVLQNGRTYYKILPESILFKNLIRADSTGIYYYDNVCDSEWLFYSFSIPVGQQIKVPLGHCNNADSPVINKSSEDSIIYLGNNVNSFIYH